MSYKKDAVQHSNHETDKEKIESHENIADPSLIPAMIQDRMPEQEICSDHKTPDINPSDTQGLCLFIFFKFNLNL